MMIIMYMLSSLVCLCVYAVDVAALCFCVIGCVVFFCGCATRAQVCCLLAGGSTEQKELPNFFFISSLYEQPLW